MSLYIDSTDPPRAGGALTPPAAWRHSRPAQWAETLRWRDRAPLFSLDFKHWPFFSSPTLAGDLLYIGSHQGRLLAIDLKTGKLAWTFLTDGAQKNGAAWTRSDGTPNYQAAVSDSFYDQMVIGVDRLMSVGAVLSTPAIDGDLLFFGSWDGQLYAIG